MTTDPDPAAADATGAAILAAGLILPATLVGDLGDEQGGHLVQTMVHHLVERIEADPPAIAGRIYAAALRHVADILESLGDPGASEQVIDRLAAALEQLPPADRGDYRETLTGLCETLAADPVLDPGATLVLTALQLAISDSGTTHGDD